MWQCFSLQFVKTPCTHLNTYLQAQELQGGLAALLAAIYENPCTPTNPYLQAQELQGDAAVLLAAVGEHPLPLRQALQQGAQLRAQRSLELAQSCLGNASASTITCPAAHRPLARTIKVLLIGSVQSCVCVAC